MKIYFTIILLFCSTIIFGQKIEKKLTDEKVRQVATACCRNVNYAKSEGIEIPPWRSTMERHLEFKGNNKEFQTFFHDFLNTYKNQIICPQYKVGSRIYPRQHLYKRLLAVGMDETYEEYFFNLEEGEIDFNAYEIIDGKKETVLDWIEKWIALGRGNADQLRDIGSILEDEYGAKYGKELPD